MGQNIKILQMLRAWRNKATSRCHVPPGHFPVCVGSSGRRYVVRATYLNHPIFRQLLSEAEEEYGFACPSGPLAIPCDESVFEEILRFLSPPDSYLRRGCHVSVRSQDIGFLCESQPLLYH